MSLKHAYFRLRDSLRFNLAKARYDFTPEGKDEDFDFHKFKQVVIAKIDGKLGDSQVMTHFYATLQKECPDLKLTIICPKSLTRIYRECLHFSSIYEVSRKPKASELKTLAEKIGPCDLFITTEPHFRPRDFILAHALRPRFTAGFENRVQCIGYLLDSEPSTMHISECFEKLLLKGKIEPSAVSYTPFTTPEAEERISPLLEDKEVIGVNPWASTAKRRFNDETVIAIIQEIQKNAQRYALLLIPPHHEDFKKLIQEQTDAQRLLFLPDDSTPMDLSVAIAKCKALVTVDTAAVHMACSWKVPQFCVYAGTHPSDARRWAPLQGMATVFSKPGVPIIELPKADVLNEVRAFLSTSITSQNI